MKPDDKEFVSSLQEVAKLTSKFTKSNVRQAVKTIIPSAKDIVIRERYNNGLVIVKFKVTWKLGLFFKLNPDIRETLFYSIRKVLAGMKPESVVVQVKIKTMWFFEWELMI